MAADDNDNEVDGNGVTGDDDGYVSYYNIVKLNILLICLHYNFYCRRLLPPGEQRCEGHGPAQCRRTFEGAGGFFSGVL